MVQKTGIRCINCSSLYNKELINAKYMAIIDIRDLSGINTSYGFATGNNLLENLERKLKHYLCSEKIEISNFYADRYIAYSDDFFNDITFKEVILERINIIENQGMTIGKDTVNFKLLVGFSIGMNAGIEKALKALAFSKENNLTHYSYEDMIENKKNDYRRNAEVVKIINDALKQDLIYPHYQPIFNNLTNEIDKYECLARIGINKSVPPNIFLDLAKKNGLYSNITEKIFIKALEKFKDTNYSFAINISKDDLCNKKTLDFIEEQLNNYPNPQNIVFELLEDQNFYDNQVLVNEFINRVKKYDCKIAIDDFGTGFSNIMILASLNIDIVKLDGSIIKEITNADVEKLVELIVKYCEIKNIKIVAEYIEDKFIFEKIKKLKIQYSQGYYIGKPKENL